MNTLKEEANEMVELNGDSVQAHDGKEDTKNNTIEHRNVAIEESVLEYS